MQLQLPPQWDTVLSNELQKPYFEELRAQLAKEYGSTTCYPPQELILVLLIIVILAT
jgi:uracil-DNA glycosylase